MEDKKELEMKQRVDELIQALIDVGFTDVRINTRFFFDTPFHYFCVTHNRTVIIDEISDPTLQRYGIEQIVNTIKNMWMKRSRKDW